MQLRSRSSVILVILFFCLLETHGVNPTFTVNRDDDFVHGVFPDGFMWGAASASYQVEGGWDVDGKGKSIWDVFTHKTPSLIFDNSTGDIACDSYRLYKRDVQMAKELALSHYRFSLSWPRLLPNATTDFVNQEGLNYYNNLIDELRANDIQPLVTLYHWDLPDVLQEKYGGWPNEALIDYFANYSRFAFSTFGDRVKFWLTFNEPLSFLTAYEDGVAAPGQLTKGYSVYQGAHTVLKAHARAWHIYDDEFRSSQNGSVSITLDYAWSEGNSSSEEDRDAANRSITWELDWFAHPIYSDKGDYPELMKEIIAKRSAEQGLEKSRLPAFSEYWKSYIQGTADFFGLNHYTTVLCTPQWATNKSEISLSSDVQINRFQDSSWPKSASHWLKVVPWGFRKALVYIKERYNNPPVIVTENGFSDDGNDMDDQDRIYQIKWYVDEMLTAHLYHGCNITGYFHWSLMDNFEWERGYSEKFGLYHVDFNDSERTRTPKSSASFYAQIIRNNGFPPNYTTE